VNRLPRQYPEGSRLVYNDRQYQVVEVTSAQAACELGGATSWCTRFPETSEDYLADNPLYVLYEGGKRFGQFYYDMGRNEIQVKNLDNEDMDLPLELEHFFHEYGMMPIEEEEEDEPSRWNPFQGEDDEDEEDELERYNERIRQDEEIRRQHEEQQRMRQQRGQGVGYGH
jgi:hypothetical protein